MKRAAVVSFVLVALFLFLFFVSVFSIVWAQSTTDWWPMVHHDPTHSGYSTSTAPNTNQTQWIYTTGNMADFSPPAVADGKVYIGSFDNNVYCLNSANGDLVWKCTTDNYVSSCPAVADGKVYFGAFDNNVYCLDASNGNITWKYTTGGDVDSSPAISGGRIYVGSWDHNVYCLDAANGDLIWKYTTGSYVDSSPAVVDGKVYIGSFDNNVHCLDASNGNLIWKYTTGFFVSSSPAVVDGRVYVGSQDDNVYCLDASNGNLIWKYTTGGLVSSSPAVADGKVYVGSVDNNVYCLAASNGDFIWKYTTGGEVWSSPTVADGKVYAGSLDNNVYCLAASNGNLIWKYTTGGSVGGGAIPAVADGKVYVGSGDGSVYAFGAGETTTPTPSSTPSVAQLYTVAWVPPPQNAAAATIVTAVAVAVVSIVVAAVSNPVGTSAGKAAEKTRDLIPESVKKWLSDFASSKRKPALDQKTGSLFLPSKAEALAYGVSLAVLTISFSYVKVNDFTLILAVLPTILATAVIVEFVKTFVLVVFARKLGVWTEHRLWYFGLAMFLVTTFAFGVPFSSPSRSLYHAPKYTKRREGIVSAVAILVTLAFGGVFFVLLVSGFTLIGSTGLAMCIIMAFLDTFPVAPMNGKAILAHSKAAWAVLFAATLAVYISWLILL
jgi:outer membrane protein assembly factor BamB